ncbi:MAG: alpha/beta fold hydrolase [bacterium]
MKPESLELSGISGPIAALDYGDPGFPPVLALHGWLDNAASFEPLSAHLKNYRLIALDFAGHGFSGHRPPGTKYHLVDYVADVAHALKDLELEKVRLMGHSLGAGVSILFAAVYPEVVEKLVLIDGVGPITESTVGASERLRNAIDAGLKHALEPSLSPRTYSQWQTLIEARTKASPISNRSAELLVRRNASEQGKDIILHSDRRLRHPSPVYFTEDAVLHFVEQVACPTLVVLAKEGMVMHRDQTKARLSAFRNVTVIECEGQHHLHMDQPQQIALRIDKFLAD